MSGTRTWRPIVGGDVALTDDNLARIGYAAVLEAQAKAITTAMLKVICGLTHEQWVKLDYAQMGDICSRLLDKSAGLDDTLTALLEAVEATRARVHELRHIVVHATWGEDGGSSRDPIGYDYRRKRRLTVKDVEEAAAGCAELKFAAHAAAMRLGELIDDGLLPERAKGTTGLNLCVRGRWVRF